MRQNIKPRELTWRAKLTQQSHGSEYLGAEPLGEVICTGLSLEVELEKHIRKWICEIGGSWGFEKLRECFRFNQVEDRVEHSIEYLIRFGYWNTEWFILTYEIFII